MKNEATKSWLLSEWRLMLSILMPVLTVAASYFLLKQDVAVLLYRVDKIENNHLVHVQDSLDKLTDALEKLSVEEAQTSVLLNQHLNSK